MALPATSLSITSFLLNSVQIKEQLQTASVRADNTLADARGIADRYENNVPTKQEQSIDITAHWYDSVNSVESTPLDVTLWSLGGTDYSVAQIKGGSIEITNDGPDASGMTQTVKAMVPTKTALTIRSELMIVTEGVFTNQQLTAIFTTGGLNVAASITLPGETITAPMILRATDHTVQRGEIHFENVELSLRGTPTAPSDSSILSLALLGAAVCAVDYDSAVNEYKTGVGKYVVINRLGLTFRDGALIEQSMRLVFQGGATIVAGG